MITGHKLCAWSDPRRTVPKWCPQVVPEKLGAASGTRSVAPKTGEGRGRKKKLARSRFQAVRAHPQSVSVAAIAFIMGAVLPWLVELGPVLHVSYEHFSLLQGPVLHVSCEPSSLLQKVGVLCSRLPISLFRAPSHEPSNSHLSTLQGTDSMVLAVTLFYSVTTACVSSPTDLEMCPEALTRSRRSPLRSPPLPSGTSETWIKKIGHFFHGQRKSPFLGGVRWKLKSQLCRDTFLIGLDAMKW